VAIGEQQRPGEAHSGVGSYGLGPCLPFRIGSAPLAPGPGPARLARRGPSRSMERRTAIGRFRAVGVTALATNSLTLWRPPWVHAVEPLVACGDELGRAQRAILLLVATFGDGSQQVDDPKRAACLGWSVGF
jgi:hypothetical protein